MTAPNVVQVSTITGKTNVQAVSTTYANLIFNPANSSQLYKVNFITLSNANGFPQQGTVDVYRNSNSYTIISNVVIPASATMTVIGKDTAIYLEEGDAIRCYANTSANVNAVSSYEIIS
jgi:hypothetical protein